MSSYEFERIVGFTIAWIWIFLPIIPILRAWLRSYQAANARVEVRILLVLITISYGWILFAVVFTWALGRDYSKQRSTIILANMAAMVTLTVLALVRGRHQRRILAMPGFVTASVWFYFLAVSSAV